MTLRARSLPFALLAFCLGCSTPPPPVPVEAGVDAEPDVKPDVFVGTGNLVLTWTVRGMPPAMGCAAAGAASVRFPANFVQFPQDTVVPCTQGEVRINDTGASLAAITGELLDAGGTTIHTYVAEATVMAGETTTVPLRFEAPGSLRVRWTINGESASANCAAVTGYGVSLDARPVDPRPSSMRGAYQCRAGAYTFSNFQVGAARISARLFSMERNLASAMGEAEVTSGATTTLELNFDAPVRVDP